MGRTGWTGSPQWGQTTLQPGSRDGRMSFVSGYERCRTGVRAVLTRRDPQYQGRSMCRLNDWTDDTG